MSDVDVSPAKRGRPAKPKYRVINRPMRFGDKMLKVGQIVPGAADWPRVDAWERARRIELVEE